jgi:hypothetical protein
VSARPARVAGKGNDDESVSLTDRSSGHHDTESGPALFAAYTFWQKDSEDLSRIDRSGPIKRHGRGCRLRNPLVCVSTGQPVSGRHLRLGQSLPLVRFSLEF